MAQFSATANYLGQEITITSDKFEEVHQALARIEELNQDAYFLLKKQNQQDASKLAPMYRTNDGNDFYGVRMRGTDRTPNVTFGKYRSSDALIPFFPKGEKSYYDPDNPSETRTVRSEPQSSNGNRGQQPQRPEYVEDDDMPF